MTLSAFERVLLGVALVSLAYRHFTTEWPIQIEVVDE